MLGQTLLEIIRTDIEDFGLTFREAFNYTTDFVYTLTQDNIDVSSLQITVNGVDIDSVSGASYSYDELTNRVSFTGLTAGDAVVFIYTYYDYSDTRLIKYIRSAISRIATHYPQDLVLVEESGNEFMICDAEESSAPEVSNKWYGLVALITQVLIKPDWVSYKTLDVSIVFPEKLSKEDKVNKLISDFREDRIGVFGTIDQITEYQQNAGTVTEE
jgi:hypothetical protein